MSNVYRIGEVAKRTGCSPESIRHYEKRGLLKPPTRGEQGYRLYSDKTLSRIGFIRHGRELGLDLTTIRELLVLSDQPEQSCAIVDDIASRHLAQLDERIRALQALAGELRQVIEQCRGGTTAECRIIQALFEHSAQPSPH